MFFSPRLNVLLPFTIINFWNSFVNFIVSWILLSYKHRWLGNEHELDNYIFIIEIIPLPPQLKFIPSVKDYKQVQSFYFECLGDLVNIQNIKRITKWNFFLWTKTPPQMYLKTAIHCIYYHWLSAVDFLFLLSTE